MLTTCSTANDREFIGRRSPYIKQDIIGQYDKPRSHCQDRENDENSDNPGLECGKTFGQKGEVAHCRDDM